MQHGKKMEFRLGDTAVGSFMVKPTITWTLREARMQSSPADGKTHNYLDTAGGEDAILASGVRISFVEHR